MPVLEGLLIWQQRTKCGQVTPSCFLLCAVLCSWAEHIPCRHQTRLRAVLAGCLPTSRHETAVQPTWYTAVCCAVCWRHNPQRSFWQQQQQQQQRCSLTHLMRRKVRADAGHLAAVEGESHPHRALVATHSQNSTGHTGGADLTQVILQGMHISKKHMLKHKLRLDCCCPK